MYIYLRVFKTFSTEDVIIEIHVYLSQSVETFSTEDVIIEIHVYLSQSVETFSTEDVIIEMCWYQEPTLTITPRCLRYTIRLS